MNFASFGKILLVVGAGLIVLGGVLLLLSRLGVTRLPGDIVIRRGNFTFFFPVATSILISLLLTGIFYLINRFR